MNSNLTELQKTVNLMARLVRYGIYGLILGVLIFLIYALVGDIQGAQELAKAPVAMVCNQQLVMVSPANVAQWQLQGCTIR